MVFSLGVCSWATVLVASPLYVFQPTHAKVIIRQIIEGSLLNKAVSVVNSGSSSAVCARKPYAWLPSRRAALPRLLAVECIHACPVIENFAQDISGWRLEERVNVPSGTVQDRYTWGPGTVLEPGQVTTLCNSQASEFLLQQCNDTIGLGMNGNDAILLYSQTGDVMVRSGPSPPGCHARNTPAMLMICFVCCQIHSSRAIEVHRVGSACSGAKFVTHHHLILA